jgi:thioredoxin reductase (NADPH)
MSEAARYRGRDICVVGGANSAGQGALFFSKYARSVSMLVRADGLLPMMSSYLVDRINAAPNISVVPEVEVHEVTGDGHVECVVVRNVKSGATTAIPSAAVFVFIGTSPRADAFASILDRDSAGFLMTGTDLPLEHGRPHGWGLAREPFAFETNIPGVFAAGDVRSGANRRVAAAVGEGSAAIYSVHRYLRTV